MMQQPSILLYWYLQIVITLECNLHSIKINDEIKAEILQTGSIQISFPIEKNFIKLFKHIENIAHNIKNYLSKWTHLLCIERFIKDGF